tara:strand:- start:146 stop:730 length:585 start_codon:yes stop_codon:yes gene_type:complete
MDSNDDARDSIKDLLGDSDLPIEVGNNLPAFNEVERIDQSIVKDKATKKATKLVDSVLKLYLSSDMISKSEYVKAKALVDRSTLTTLIGQIEKLEHALDVMINNIDNGEMHPRMFEVYAGLQKTMLELLKHQTLHMHAMEEGAKKIKHDLDMYSDNIIQVGEEIEDKDETESLSMGTRNLMRDIQNNIKEDTDE